MKALGEAFAQHLASGATSLATCWVLTRADGIVLGFTDHDEVVSVGAVRCTPLAGFTGGEAAHRAGPQVDTTEVIGVLSDEAISAADIEAGLYAGASVAVWRVNWRAPEQRALLAQAQIGEIVREDAQFRAELRSGQAALNQTTGRVYGLFCDAVLGDRRCKVAATHANFAKGCDRQFATCCARFDNAVNFRGFPHVPGSDFLMRYPNSTRASDGTALYA